MKKYEDLLLESKLEKSRIFTNTPNILVNSYKNELKFIDDLKEWLTENDFYTHEITNIINNLPFENNLKKDLKITFLLNEKVGMTQMIDDLYLKYKKDPDWRKKVSQDLKNEYGLKTDKKDKRTYLMIMNILSSEEYFDID